MTSIWSPGLTITRSAAARARSRCSSGTTAPCEPRLVDRRALRRTGDELRTAGLELLPDAFEHPAPQRRAQARGDSVEVPECLPPGGQNDHGVVAEHGVD